MDLLRVGFIGLGDQGAPMACAIADAGFPLSVWARRPQSLEAVANVRHTVADSPADLAAGCDLVALCVRTDADVAEVLVQGGILDQLPPGAIVANHGTGSPRAAAALCARGAACGVAVLDAPVSGSSEAARAGTLTTMIGGDGAAVERIRPVLDTFSRLVVHLGPAGSGQLAKLVNNALLAANLKNAAEALEVGHLLGFDLDGLVELLQASSGASTALHAIANLIPLDLADHYEKTIGKDLRHFVEECRLRELPVSPIEEAALAGVAGIATAVEHLHARTIHPAAPGIV